MIGNSPLARDFWEQGRSPSCPIIDVHGHMGEWAAIYMPRSAVDQMIGTMDECGIRLLVFSHHAALNVPDLGNRLSVEAVRRYPDRLRAYCVINPNYPDLAEAELACYEQHLDVYAGLKFHPDLHHIALTDEGYRPALEFADRKGLPVLSHTWANSPYDGPEQVRKLAERYHHLSLLLGHSCHFAWDEAVALARDFPNVYLELTALFDDRGVLEKFAAEAGSERMLFGTDLPWFDPHQAVGALLSAHLSDEELHNICHRNAEKVFAHIWK
jgi:predicted TIM-barrel fold metal-dependent hydrolase